MIQLMIGSDYKRRSDTGTIMNYIFFKDEQYRYNLINKAQTIFKIDNAMLQQEIKVKLFEKKIFRLIPHLQNLVSFAKIPSHENWNEAIHKTIINGMINSKKGAKYDFNKFQDLIRFCRNMCEHYREIISDNPAFVPIIGATMEDVIRYFVKCFPWLMIVVQMIVDDYGSKL